MDDTGKKFAAVVLPNLSREAEFCVKHRDVSGQGICSACHQFFCGDCLAWDEISLSLKCHSCRLENKTKKAAVSIFDYFWNPLFVVFIMMLSGVYYYVQAQGKETVGAVEKREAAQPWFRRDTGLKYLHQAMEARSRAVFLEEKGHKAEARRWYALVYKALRRSQSSMSDAPGQLDFEIGKAGALGKSSTPAAGLALLLPLKSKIKKSSPLFLPFLSLRAELLWEDGQEKQALADWKTILANSQPRSMGAMGSLIDDAVEKMSRGLFEASVTSQLQMACNTAPGKKSWRARALDAMSLRSSDILKLESSLNTSEDPEGCGPGMRMERFD